MNRTSKMLGAVVIALGVALPAQALTITPSTAACGSAECLATSGNETGQAAINAALAAFFLDEGYTGVTELYKQDVGDPDSGTYAGSYTTTFSNTATDPEDALIDYISGPSIGGTPIYLLVKDGDQEPAWYLFDISNWNGTDDIVLQDFWPDQGAISHVAIYGGSASVPDGGSMAMLMGVALMGLAGARRLFS
jgi:hypothetical protein